MKNLLVIALIFAMGCTQVIVEKPDGTRIQANVFGSTKLDAMHYERDGILLEINGMNQTPDGLAELIGEAVAAAIKAGVMP